ncbi:MAG TPA: dihydroxy-acid dehydratase [Deltaproteobacteria bacterium]|nr:dihydroxy-acid dehydratase [Deltaproteobacteria bacterium]
MTMEEKKSKEDRYNEARILHKSLDEKLQTLQAKPYLTEDEELEIKLLKKKKLYFKDMMEKISQET